MSLAPSNIQRTYANRSHNYVSIDTNVSRGVLETLSFGHFLYHSLFHWFKSKWVIHFRNWIHIKWWDIHWFYLIKKWALKRMSKR